MSRLYDALRGSPGFRHGADGCAGEGVWEELGIDGANVPSAVADSDVRVADADVSEIAEFTASHDLEVVLPEGERAAALPTRPNGFCGIPTKATISQKTRLIANATDPAIAEHYRKLRTKIEQIREEKPIRSIAVTSPNPQEGKTITVLNLGYTFAMLPSLRVLIVDGDTRKGTLGRWLGVGDEQPGLSNLIDGSAQLEDVVLKAQEIPMYVITSGSSRVTDLHSSQLGRHFQRMIEQFDLVLVDTPPANLVADVQLLAANCEAVLLLARAFSTTRKAYEKALQDLSPFNIIGTVLNGGTKENSRYHGYY